MSADTRKTQRAKILALLVDANGGWVGLSQILALHIAQYNSRILELRRLGFNVFNRTERVDGKVRSWFRLQVGPVDQQLALLQLPERPPEYPD